MLNRKKFSRFSDFLSNAQILLTEIEHRGTTFFPSVRIDLLNDKDDNKLLELAESSGADFLITGNLNDFTMPFYKQTKIISPKDYYEAHVR